MKHHYQVAIFNIVIDFQLIEISERFSNNTIVLLTALDSIHHLSYSTLIIFTILLRYFIKGLHPERT